MESFRGRFSLQYSIYLDPCNAKASNTPLTGVSPSVIESIIIFTTIMIKYSRTT